MKQIKRFYYWLHVIHCGALIAMAYDNKPVENLFKDLVWWKFKYNQCAK